MVVITLGTGSLGNCYIVKADNGKSIILDCGLPFREITKDKNFPKFDDIELVFCSHSHKDHSKSFEDFKRSGVNYLSWEDKQKVYYQYGQFIVMLFPLAHNVDNCGIIITDTTNNEKLCYATDFYKIPKIEGIDIWLYEINFDSKTVEKLIEKNELNAHLRNALKSHNSLESAKEYFAQIKTKPKKIIFCHLSTCHCDRRKVLKFGKTICDNVSIAQKEI